MFTGWLSRCSKACYLSGIYGVAWYHESKGLNCSLSRKFKVQKQIHGLSNYTRWQLLPGLVFSQLGPVRPNGTKNCRPCAVQWYWNWNWSSRVAKMERTFSLLHPIPVVSISAQRRLLHKLTPPSATISAVAPPPVLSPSLSLSVPSVLFSAFTNLSTLSWRRPRN